MTCQFLVRLGGIVNRQWRSHFTGNCLQCTLSNKSALQSGKNALQKHDRHSRWVMYRALCRGWNLSLTNAEKSAELRSRYNGGLPIWLDCRRGRPAPETNAANLPHFCSLLFPSPLLFWPSFSRLTNDVEHCNSPLTILEYFEYKSFVSWPFKLPGPWLTLPLLFLLLLYFLPLYLVVVYYAILRFFFFFYSRAAVSVVFSTLLSCSGFIMCSLFASCIFFWTNKDDDDDDDAEIRALKTRSFCQI